MEFEIEIINPAKHPELAAQQVVIELIRAGKIDNSFNGIKALNTYQNLVEKYKALSAETAVVEVKDNAVEPPAAVAVSSKPVAIVAKAKNHADKPPVAVKPQAKATASEASGVIAEVVAKPKKTKTNPTPAKKR